MHQDYLDTGQASARLIPLIQNGSENQMQVSVRDNDVDQAIQVLKKKLQREGLHREMKLKPHFEKQSEKKAREKGEAIRRALEPVRKKFECVE